MSVIFWRKTEPVEFDDRHPPRDVAASEQDPLPSAIFYARDESEIPEAVSPSHPMPVELTTSIPLVRIVQTPLTAVPGITAADALDAGDQMGAVIRFGNIPNTGIIREIRYFDPDNEGIDKELWLFSGPPTLAASDAAFSLADADLYNVVGMFIISTWRSAANGQIGFTANTPCVYKLPEGGTTLYGALKTYGADNIAASVDPRIQLAIEVAS